MGEPDQSVGDVASRSRPGRRSGLGRALRIAAWVLGGIVLLLAAGVAFLVFLFNWNDLKGVVASQSSRASGRDVAIDGNIEVHLSLTPHIRIDGLRLGNPPWAADPQLARIGSLQFSIKLLELLRGRMVLPEVVLEEPKISLEKGEDGKATWSFGENPGSVAVAKTAVPSRRENFPIIGNLVIRNGTVRYLDRKAGIDISSQVSTAVGTAAGQQQVTLHGEGTFQKQRFTLDMTAGSLLQMRRSEVPYPLTVDAAIGDTRGHIRGTLTRPLDLGGLDLTLRLSGRNMAELFPIFGIPVPPTPPYDLTGKLEHEGDVWRFTRAAGRLGNSDLAGDITIDVGHERPLLKAALRSRRLDYTALAGLIGAAPPGSGTAAPHKAAGRVLPDTPIDVARLRAMDMDVTLDAQQVIVPDMPLQALQARFQLDNGRLTVDPLRFGIAQGDIAGSVVVDGRKAVPTAAADLSISKVDLARFFAGTRFAKEIRGTLAGRAKLAGHGRSFADLLGTASGDAAVFGANGQFSKLVVKLIGLDIAQSLGLLIAKDEPVRLRCIVGDFAVEDGLMAARTLVLDTSDSNITGDGTISLSREALKLTIEAHPKDPTALSARAPIHITGTFADPSAAPDAKVLAARGGAAVALGALLSPAAALLPFIDLGLGKDSPCQQLIAEARRDVRK
jgi:uncharacterized protein involved in outer membrane biogenesis